jgi:hypothetical protein
MDVEGACGLATGLEEIGSIKIYARPKAFSKTARRTPQDVENVKGCRSSSVEFGMAGFEWGGQIATRSGST